MLNIVVIVNLRVADAARGELDGGETKGREPNIEKKKLFFL